MLLRLAQDLCTGNQHWLLTEVEHGPDLQQIISLRLHGLDEGREELEGSRVGCSYTCLTVLCVYLRKKEAMWLGHPLCLSTSLWQCSHAPQRTWKLARAHSEKWGPPVLPAPSGSFNSVGNSQRNSNKSVNKTPSWLSMTLYTLPIVNIDMKEHCT